MMKGMVFAERYKLEDFIGQGGMSLVYRAVDIRTGHSVAVKILKSEYNSDKEFLERFQREAQAASLMSHHNLVNLLDVGVEGEYRYLVLEYVNGNTLKDIIRQKGRLNYQTAIQITIRILSALQHAHDNGIIHRDIKPQNVLIHADGHVKVSDFGIARMTNAFTISKGDTVVGSVHYSSPEQATGSVVEATSDIYSTGVVAVVMKALEKNPKNRFQSAREMADALMKAKDGKLDPASVVLESSGPRPAVKPAQQSARMRELSPHGAQGTARRPCAGGALQSWCCPAWRRQACWRRWPSAWCRCIPASAAAPSRPMWWASAWAMRRPWPAARASTGSRPISTTIPSPRGLSSHRFPNPTPPWKRATACLLRSAWAL